MWNEERRVPCAYISFGGEDLPPVPQCLGTGQSVGEKSTEFLSQFGEAKVLRNDIIPSCWRRHSLEPTDIQDKDPHFRHPGDDQGN